MNDDIKALIDNYQMSDAGKQLLARNQLVMLVSVTAGGKNTIIQKMLNTHKYHYVVSHTTRDKRMNNGEMEEDGREFWFVSMDDMQKKLENGEFLEAKIVHQKNVYGTSFDELQKAETAGKVALLEIDVQGVDEIIEAKPDAQAIFIVPPSFEEWQRRIENRGVSDRSDLLQRLETAEKELEQAVNNEYFTFVVNDDLDDAVMDTEAIIRGNADEEKLAAAKDRAWEILNNLKSHIHS